MCLGEFASALVVRILCFYFRGVWVQSLVREQRTCRLWMTGQKKKKKKKSNNNKTKKSQQKKLTSSPLVSQFYLIMDILINFYSCKTDHAIHLLKIL